MVAVGGGQRQVVIAGADGWEGAAGGGTRGIIVERGIPRVAAGGASRGAPVVGGEAR